MLTNIKSSLKLSVTYGLGNMSIKLVGLILFPLYSKHLSIAEYGILSILEISTQFLVTVFSFNINSALLRFYFDKKYEDSRNSMYYSSSLITILLATLMYIVIFTLAHDISIFLFDTSDYTYLIKIIGFSSAINIISKMSLTLLRVQEKAVQFTITNILKLLIILFATLFLLLKAERGLTGIFEAQVLGGIVHLAILIIITRKDLIFTFKPKMVKEMLSYSFPLMISAIATIIITISDRYCLRFLAGFSEVGLYSTGYKVANVLTLVGSSVQMAITPLIFKKLNDADNKRFHSKTMTYFTFCMLILIIGISIFGQEIIQLLAQDKSYWSSYIVIPVISFSVLFSMMRYTSSLGLSIEKKTGIISVITIIISLLNIALNILFIPIFGYMGAAIATLIAQILYFITIQYFAQKHYPVPYENSKLLIQIILSAILVIVTLLYIDFSWAINIFLKLIIIILFPILLYFFNFYEKVEILTIKKFLHSFFNTRKNNN